MVFILGIERKRLRRRDNKPGYILDNPRLILILQIVASLLKHTVVKDRLLWPWASTAEQIATSLLAFFREAEI